MGDPYRDAVDQVVGQWEAGYIFDWPGSTTTQRLEDLILVTAGIHCLYPAELRRRVLLAMDLDALAAILRDI